MKVQEQYLVGNTFPIDGEIAEMAMPFLREVLPSAAIVSPEPLDIGGCLTTQNVRNGHIRGGHLYIFMSKSQWLLR